MPTRPPRRWTTPSHPIRLAFAGLAALAFAVPAPADAQITRVPMICLSQPVPDACASKMAHFRAYLEQMAAGVNLFSLPPLYVELLQYHFPSIDVGQWRFGYSDRQPPGNATTDCDRTYFNNANYVAQLRNGTTEDFYPWLTHEIAHYAQCVEVGGTDAYALMWWNDLDPAIVETVLARGNMEYLHDAMDMEEDAESRAEQITSELYDCCIHPETGRLHEPLEVGEIEVSPARPFEGDEVTFDLPLSKGAEPYFVEWEVVRPGGVTDRLTSGPDVVVRDPGSWQVKATVFQGTETCQSGSLEALPCVTVEGSFTVAAPAITSLSVEDPVLDPGGSTTATVRLGDVRRDHSITVDLSSSLALVDVPATVTATGSGGLQASATFPVTVDLPDNLLFRDRTVRVEATIDGDSRRAASTEVTVRGYDLVTFESIRRVDRRRGETYGVRAVLDRPPPRDVVIQLENGDPRSLSVPSQLTIRAGTTEGVVTVSPTRSLRTTKTVSVVARTGSRDIGTRETTLQVRPRSR